MINLQNFQLWFKRILENLYNDPHSGFPILMITFPLLERYLREKSGSYEDKLNDKFHAELITMFPELKDTITSEKFWKIYRNGILHQATLREVDKTIHGCITNQYSDIRVDNGGMIYINPAGFSKKVITAIEKDFKTFIAAHSMNHMLSIVYELEGGGAGTSGHGIKGVPPGGSIDTNVTVSSGIIRRFTP